LRYCRKQQCIARARACFPRKKREGRLMKISSKDKRLLFEQEFLALMFIIILSLLFNYLRTEWFFYLAALALGFVLYMWMIHEEEIHTTGKKHVYFEHTSSYIMMAQTALALQLLFMHLNMEILMYVFLPLSVIMYGVSLSRIFLYKIVFAGRTA
jgi:hypothetical protein